MKNYIKKTIKKYIARIIWPNTYCNEAYIKYLRKCGAKIGKRTRFIAPKECNVDIGRAEYVTIGDDCCLSFVTILAHDYSWYVFGRKYQNLLPDPGGEVIIGNNCFIGYQTCILKDTTIGDNVIIGARSVVKGQIPSNTVWAGTPARQICTLDELYERRKSSHISDAFKRYEIISRHNHKNDYEEMGYFTSLFVEHDEQNYEKLFKNIEFNGILDCPVVKEWFLNGKSLYSDKKEFEKDYLKSKLQFESQKG